MTKIKKNALNVVKKIQKMFEITKLNKIVQKTVNFKKP